MGSEMCIRDRVKAVSHHLNKEVPHSIKPRREGDPPVLVADPTKIRNLLGFKAQHSELDNIIKTATQWHKTYVPRDHAVSK